MLTAISAIVILNARSAVIAEIPVDKKAAAQGLRRCPGIGDQSALASW